MINKTFKIKPISLALLLAGIGMAQFSYAVDLVAIDGQWSPDGGTTQIPMWGFVTDTGQACGSLPAWTVGPQLTDDDLVAGDLMINLRNCLVNDPVSIVIPGQPATFTPVTTVDGNGRTRITAFTHEAAANGGTASYSWTVKPGTYLYQSGSHPAKQVQMGLYGALTIGVYPGTSGDVTLLYSEIDPVLHSTATAATPLGYHPRHFLVSQSGTAGDTNQPTVLRMLNAGLDFHVPTLSSGYMSLVAEDGNAYPFAKQQYSANVAAGKTIDALWKPASEGDHVIYDRRGNGMVATVSVSDGGDIIPPVITLLGTDPVDVVVDSIYTDAGATATDNVDPTVTVITNNPVDTATADTYTVTYDATDAAGNAAVQVTRMVNVIAADITPPVITLLGNDPVDVEVGSTYTDAGAMATDNIDGDLGLLVGTGIVDTGTEGTYIVTYDAMDAAGNSAVQVTRTVNVIPVAVAPVAMPDDYGTDEDVALSVAAAGVLANDGTGLTAILVSGPSNGNLNLAADGSFSYTPIADFNGADSFSYKANDGTLDSNNAIVTITVTAVNDAPVAVEETATVQRNSAATFINLTGNDSDVDDGPGVVVGNLKDDLGNVTNGDPASGSITITTGSTTTRGGTVTVLTNGVNYTPKRNFRGTDTFNYTVTDTSGDPDTETSNEVTVRVNVVK